MTITYKAIQLNIDDSAMLKLLCSSNIELINGMCNRVESCISNVVNLIGRTPIQIGSTTTDTQVNDVSKQ